MGGVRIEIDCISTLGAGPHWAGPETDIHSPCRRIVDRMDLAGDSDGWVSLAELRAWIAHTQQRHIRDSVSAAWHTYDTDRDGRVGWEELRNATYGHYEPGMVCPPRLCPMTSLLGSCH